MKALIMIDSFKGSLSSAELGLIAADTLKEYGIDSVFFPISDGGDGFLDVIASCRKTTPHQILIKDPLGRFISSYYLTDELGSVYIEMAKTSGLELLKEEELNPFLATSHGLGDMMKDAVKKGYKKVYLGLGGTATTDAGMGMLEALGALFYSHKTPYVNIKPKDFLQIDDINLSSVIDEFKDVDITILSDVTSPLLGPLGAVYQFGPQKGAKKQDLPLLEQGIAHIAKLIDTNQEILGGGAAGGVSYTLQSTFHAKVNAGIDTLLQWLEFDRKIQEVDIIITGEGKIDLQTLEGKVVTGVMKRSKNKPMILVCALQEITLTKQQYADIEAIYAIVPNITNKTQSWENPKHYFKKLMQEVGRDLKAGRRDSCVNES